MSARSKDKERDDEEQCGDVFHTTEHRMRWLLARLKFGRKTALKIFSFSGAFTPKTNSKSDTTTADVRRDCMGNAPPLVAKTEYPQHHIMKKPLFTSLLALGFAMFGPAAIADEDRDRDHRDHRRYEHAHRDRYDHHDYYRHDYRGERGYEHSHYYEEEGRHYHHHSTAHELLHLLIER